MTVSSSSAMKILSATSAAAAAISAGAANAANPFATKVSRNDRQSSHVGRLLAGARPTPNSQLRRLEDQEVDISAYSLKFEKCQYIKQFADEINEEMDSVLEMRRFVIFRLCPNNSCGSCDENYGEYIVDMETYLESTLQHKEEEQEQYCQACDECADEANDDANDDAANGNDDANARRRLINVDCSTCYSQCQNIANMEENGYVDAADYVGCEKVYENDNTGIVYYAGAICSHEGERIKVGLFTDEDCTQYDEDAPVDQYIKNENGYNVKISYHLLKKTFSSDDCIASCTKVDENAADDDANAAQQDVETAEVCENIYEAAGKCESPYGFANGIDYSNSEYYDVQVANEEAVCDYIDAIQTGRYDQYGEVVVRSTAARIIAGGVRTTGGQKFALTFFVIGTVGLCIYAAALLQRIKSSRSDLSAQDVGAMA
ncbi:hypothetical protein ACHAWF_012169 [Thalassiosira exigua]